MEEKIEEILRDMNPDILNYTGNNMYADGLLDSLDFVEVVENLEESFGIEFEPEIILLENFGNKNDILSIVKKVLTSQL